MKAKDLRKEPPRSPHFRIHDYVILGRTLDKCRASINGDLGEFHFDCPLDNLLFSFKGIQARDFLEQVKSGASDEQMGEWLDRNGAVQTPGSISEWSRSMEAILPYENPDKRAWFIEQCAPLGLNPKTTTLFSLLEADDKDSFPHAIQTSPDPNNWDIPLVETAPTARSSSIKATLHS